MGGKQKKCRKERVRSVAANPDNLESNKEAGGGAQGAQGSSKICTSRESASPLSRLIRGFRNKYLSLIPPREDQCEWHRMTRMTGPDCAVMCNLINIHKIIQGRLGSAAASYNGRTPSIVGLNSKALAKSNPLLYTSILKHRPFIAFYSKQFIENLKHSDLPSHAVQVNWVGTFVRLGNKGIIGISLLKHGVTGTASTNT